MTQKLTRSALETYSSGGAAAEPRAGVIAVVGITVINERIAEIDLIVDADKLAGLTINQ
jgi:hypothetical protein